MVALYFYVYQFAPSVCAIAILVLAALVFAPLRFLYPSRMTWMRGWTVAFGLLWGVAVALVLIRLPARSVALATLSLAFPAYYVLLSFYAQWRGR